MSKNAEFRAIQPIPSILSYVEDNVICMSSHLVLELYLVILSLALCFVMFEFSNWQLLGRRRMNELRKAGYNTELSAPLDNIPFSTNSERERIEENVGFPY